MVQTTLSCRFAAIHLVLPAFMEIAAGRNFLFYAHCGAKDFFGKLKRQSHLALPLFLF